MGRADPLPHFRSLGLEGDPPQETETAPISTHRLEAGRIWSISAWAARPGGRTPPFLQCWLICGLFLFWTLAFRPSLLVPRPQRHPWPRRTMSGKVLILCLWGSLLLTIHIAKLPAPPPPPQPSWKQTSKLGKKNALFLVFLGINYFYGILDRQQTIKKKTVDFLLSRKQAVSTISRSLGKPGEKLSIHHHNLSQNSPDVVSRASVNPGL